MTTNDENIKPSDASGEDTKQAAPAADPAARTGASDAANPLATLTAERDQFRDQLLRTAADFDNYRKRTRKDIEDARARGKDDALKEVLPVFDNLERAVAAAESAQTISSVVEGVKMVLKLFEDTSERMGLTRVKTVGERFDPAVHEAIQQQETDAQPPGTILAEVVPGYLVGQRLLRAAMVVVARKAVAKAADAVVDGATPGGNGPSGVSTAGDVSRPESGTADGGRNG